MKLALIGSRNFTDYDSFKQAIFKVLEEWQIELSQFSHIVSGGARGADTLAERFADEFGLEKEIYYVLKGDYLTYGKSAPLKRDHLIVQAATHIIAFPSRFGSGTQFTYSLAVKKGIIHRKLLFVD